MPFYDFRCLNCKGVNEIHIASGEYKAQAPLLRCLDCDSEVEQVITSVAMTSNCFPTRETSWGGPGSNAPNIKGLNLGHEPPTTAHIGLKPHQVKRLGL
jgi:hypothetical protein